MVCGRRSARLSALLRVLQNDAAPMHIDEPPFFDLFQRSKTAEASEIIVQAAISYARRLRGDVHITHCKAELRGLDLITRPKLNPAMHHNDRLMTYAETKMRYGWRSYIASGPDRWAPREKNFPTGKSLAYVGCV
jgi:hypothetical protein